MESSGSYQAKNRFGELVDLGPAAPLDEMAFLLADVVMGVGAGDVIEQLSRLDELAALVPSPTVGGIANFLFAGSGAFVGNRADYYDPDNSLLPRVLDRHAGIPISLSVLMIEVARRVGVPLVGVALPGHFLVGHMGADRYIPEIFIDPFHEGRLMDQGQCRSLFHSLAGDQQPFQAGYLAATPPLAIIERMLNNLKAIYLSKNDVIALRAVMTLRAMFPGLGKSESEEFRRLMAHLN